jgi:hypothetical protein
MAFTADAITFTAGGQNMLVLEEDSTDYVRIPDNVRLSVGTGNDLQLSHNATNSYIQNYTGDLYFQNHTTDGDIHFLVDDGGGNDITALQIDASENGKAIFSDSVKIPVGKSLFLGASEHTYIREDIDDRLRFFVGGSEFMRFTESSDDTIDLYHNTLIADDKYLAIGSSHDMEIKHISSQNYIDLDNGNLYFRDDADNNIFTVYREGGGVQLNEGNLKLPATSALYFDGGSDTYIQEGSADRLDFVVGGDTMLVMDEANDYNASYKDFRLNDGLKTYFGSHSDVYLYYDGTDNDFYIRNANGDTIIRNEATDADIIFSNDDGSGGNTNYMVIDGGAVSIDLLQDTRLKAAKKLYLDGGGNTYITESSADRVN